LKEYEVKINGKSHRIIIKEHEANRFMILADGRDLHVKCDGAPSFGKLLTMEVESTRYDVSLEDSPPESGVAVVVAGHRFKAILETAPTIEPPSPAISEKRRAEKPSMEEGTVYAPMPGRISKIIVHVGDTVQVGQPLLILEAMKMENEITSPRAGTVKQIHVSEGAAVNKNDPLITLT